MAAHPWAPGLALLCLAASSLLGGCSREEPHTPRPNVLLIVVDTLRADRLGSDGNRRGLTPFLDQLASRSAVFRNAYATTSWTTPSVASLLTSRYPSQHGVLSFAAKLAESELTLPELLAQAGYRTGAIIGNPLLGAGAGFDQGFASFQTLLEKKPRAPQVRAETLAWLDQVPAAQPDAPAFLYLHFMEPHWRYAPPPPYRDRFLNPGQDAVAAMRNLQPTLDQAFVSEFTSGGSKGLRQLTCDDVALLESQYDGEVASLDAELATLFAELEQRGFLRDAIVIFTADHGEEFLDHGTLWHDYTLYDESVRVPLIVYRTRAPAGRVIDRPVSLVDIAPSILELLGLPIPEVFAGHSFAPQLTRPAWLPAALDRLLDGKTKAAPLVIAQLERDAATQSQRRLHAAMIIDRPFKLVTRPQGDPELYDLVRDPQEEHDLGPTRPDVRSALLATLREAEHAVSREGPPSETIALDESARERMRALGYGVPDTDPATQKPPALTAGHIDERSPSRRERCAQR